MIDLALMFQNCIFFFTSKVAKNASLSVGQELNVPINSNTLLKFVHINF